MSRRTIVSFVRLSLMSRRFSYLIGCKLGDTEVELDDACRKMFHSFVWRKQTKAFDGPRAGRESFHHIPGGCFGCF